jgi:hypothetical protein
MTEAEHKQCHIELHKALDELVADCIRHDKYFFPSKNSVMELIEWSHQQTINPEQSKEL